MKSFVATDPPGHEGSTNTWLTPLPIVEALGEFDLDPCGFPKHETAKQLYCLPENDGLQMPWFGRVWLNPPYGRTRNPWLDKMQEHRNGIALIHARTDTIAFHKIKADLYFFLQGRIKFLTPQLTTVSNAGCGSVLLAYGRNNVSAILNSNLKGMWLK